MYEERTKKCPQIVLVMENYKKINLKMEKMEIKGK
jgi:hypothetical protein